MSNLIPAAGGERLGPDDYQADFDERFWRIGPVGFWKLERMQSYDEGDFPSYQAFVRGDWGESMRLIEELRSSYEEQYRKVADSGFTQYRVRTVERPIGPYMHWELSVLHVKALHGERVRVLDAAEAVAYETGGALPELCVMGDEAVYQVMYDASGRLDGAVRHTDAGTVTRARTLIQGLHAASEPLETYFPREVAGLAPPHGL